MKEHWKGLIVFVDNPDVPMDNNLAERILRPVVSGRNNYWREPLCMGGRIIGGNAFVIQTALCTKFHQEHI